MSLNPSSRGLITHKTFDYGSDDNGVKAERELQQFISGKASVLVHRGIEDCCYTAYEGTEEDLKVLAVEILLDSSENSGLEYYHNGKRIPLKVEVEI
jgi:hypothetical protein